MILFHHVVLNLNELDYLVKYVTGARAQGGFKFTHMVSPPYFSFSPFVLNVSPFTIYYLIKAFLYTVPVYHFLQNLHCQWTSLVDQGALNHQ